MPPEKVDLQGFADYAATVHSQSLREFIAS